MDLLHFYILQPGKLAGQTNRRKRFKDFELLQMGETKCFINKDFTISLDVIRHGSFELLINDLTTTGVDLESMINKSVTMDDVYFEISCCETDLIFEYNDVQYCYNDQYGWDIYSKVFSVELDYHGGDYIHAIISNAMNWKK